MKKKELKKVIDFLESSSNKDKAYFGIFQFGSGPDESYVKANQQGLILFVTQLLKASGEFEDVINESEAYTIPLECNDDWMHGEVFLEYLEPVNELGESRERTYKESFFDSLVPFGCVLILLLTIISTLVGFITILNWAFL